MERFCGMHYHLIIPIGPQIVGRAPDVMASGNRCVWQVQFAVWLKR